MERLPGPRKLVFIDSGVYPYAEIELDESIHFAGPNNAGKTSLLNALQFLYIDDIKIMHFPNTNFRGKTQPFYFKPHGRSTILIEVDTRWGIRTVGFHGLGAAAGCDWQRFGFDGPYVMEDFLDPETQGPREWSAVEALLAQKNYVKLTQAQLRAALRGVGEKGAFRLELVPGGGRYDTFIEVFRQLLTLKKSRPDELKQLLLSVIDEDMVSGEEGTKGIVSLASVVGDAYTRALAAQKRLERIQGVQRRTQVLLVEVGQLADIQAVLPGLVLQAFQEAVARYQDRTRKAVEAREAAQEASERAGFLADQRRTLDDDLEAINKKIGRLQGRREHLELIRERLAEEPKALLEGRLSEVQAEETQLRVDLSAFQGNTDGSRELRSRAHKQRQSANASREAAQRLRALDEPGARPSWLDLLAEYPEDERDPLLRLVNPALLSLPEGEGGMTVLDPAGLGQAINLVAAGSQDGFFKGAGIKVKLSALPVPPLDLDDPVVRAREIEKYDAQADTCEREAKRLDTLAETNKVRETTQNRLNEAERQVAELFQKSVQISAWEEEVKELPEVLDGLERLGREGAGKKSARETAMEEHEKALNLARNLNGRATSLGKEAQELQAGVIRDMEQRAFTLPDLDLDEQRQERPGLDDASFQALVRKTEEHWTKSTDLDRSIEDRLQDIESSLDGLIAGDREAKLATLKDLIDGLEIQQAQVNDAWESIAVTAKTAFSNLLRDFETLETRIRRLNRAMGKFTVSNLSNIQILLNPTSRMEVLKGFTQDEGLFMDAGLAERAKGQVGEWIARSEVFRLFDLFQVSLEVHKGSRKEVYATLEAESTGTSMTLKVIFLAHLLRDLFHGRTQVRLLIFVDEVDTLDDVNQETIRECARALGFIMIMASPNPANAKRLYFLRPEVEGEVTYIYPEETLEIVFKDEPDLEGEPDATPTEPVP